MFLIYRNSIYYLYITSLDSYRIIHIKNSPNNITILEHNDIYLQYRMSVLRRRLSTREYGSTSTLLNFNVHTMSHINWVTFSFNLTVGAYIACPTVSIKQKKIKLVHHNFIYVQKIFFTAQYHCFKDIYSQH